MTNSQPQQSFFSAKFLAGKSAIVTGATSGIGLAIARALAQIGANLTIGGFATPAEIAAVTAELGANGAKVIHSGADMADPGAIESLVAASRDAFGAIDIIVNNAGIQHVAPIEDFPAEKWNQIIAINLSAAFHLTRLTFAEMKARQWGRIINVASAHSTVASPFKSAYVAAKHGLAGLTKTIALEGAEFGVTANCISPGYVLTPLVEKQIPDTMAARNLTREAVIRDVLLYAQPTKKFVTVEEIAAMAAFLCSPAAASINGANLAIDGGWTAQ